MTTGRVKHISTISLSRIARVMHILSPLARRSPRAAQASAASRAQVPDDRETSLWKKRDGIADITASTGRRTHLGTLAVMDKSTRIAAAALFYFLIVFAVGFLCGPVRVFLLEPRLGEVLATLCEAPFLLGAMVWASRWLPRALRLKPDVTSRAMMGVGGLLLQQFADFAVGTFLRGIPPAQQLARFSTPEGLIYAALLLAFAAMPALADCPNGRPADLPRTPASLRIVKALHTLAWAFFAGCILAIPVLAWRGLFDSVGVLAVFVFIEIAVLVANEWRCPLTNVAARYTDDRSDNFDIFLPLWLARHNKLIFGWLFAIVFVFALALWLRSIWFRA